MKKKIIISIISVFCLYSCVYDTVYKTQFANYSNEGQIVYYTCADEIGSKIDSFENRYYEKIAFSRTSILNEDVYIKPNSSKWVRTHFNIKRIANCCQNNQPLRFFFISDSVFVNNPWDTIVKYQMYNRKLVFSKKDLEKNNWTVIYE